MKTEEHYENMLSLSEEYIAIAKTRLADLDGDQKIVGIISSLLHCLCAAIATAPNENIKTFLIELSRRKLSDIEKLPLVK